MFSDYLVIVRGVPRPLEWTTKITKAPVHLSDLILILPKVSMVVSRSIDHNVPKTKRKHSAAIKPRVFNRGALSLMPWLDIDTYWIRARYPL